MAENILDVKNRTEFRQWLTENHSSEKECRVELKRGRPADN